MLLQLKILYVSMTRARKHVWIADNSEAIEPMRVWARRMLAVMRGSSFSQIFWTSRDLVMMCIPGTNDPRSLSVESSEQDWEKTGRYLFKRNRYAHAELCFQRASLHHEAMVAKAHRLREKAQELPHDEADQRSKVFTDAAQAFIKSAKFATFLKATYYRIAAECFKECAKLSQAAKCYVDAGEFGIGAQLYRDAGMFSNAIQIVRKHKVQQDVAVRIEFACRLHYFRRLEVAYVR
jgi:hypothetical protein